MSGENGRLDEMDCGISAAEDALLAELYERPYVLQRPVEQRVPFIFAIPHSGRVYPPSLFRRSRLSPLNIRRSEDADVDSLFRSVGEVGAPLIAARFPRAWLDANRAPGELDPAMFAGPLTVPVEAVGPRVAAGLGVIPRLVRDGAEIYRGKLPPEEAEQRLLLHKKYHAALSSLVRETSCRFGTAVVIDCHSMPSVAGAPDIVLGDRYGTAASHVLLRHAEQAFQSQGFSLGRNVPYAGGYTTHAYGQPKRGIHALQVEINRALYLDEERIELNANFAALRCRLAAVVADLVQIDPALLRTRNDLWIAAE
jgi:N-formylglutamate amidohydrolase